ncbi:MAG: phosphodiesterase class-II:metallo-beta-lactamase-like protein [Dehalococcoidia bacterium]|nr:phosphodiesterase class-II:metallo-beta-lactamase-like protein [Dehalococcoidia bacterium]
METRLLGAHNLETRDTRHTCFLVDGILGIDAGSLVTGLTTHELENIRALLLTHHHFDHTRDVPTLGLIRRDTPATAQIYGLPETLDGVRSHLMDGDVYPDLSEELNNDPPRFNMKATKAWSTFRVEGYDVKVIPVPHPVPIIRSSTGESIAFTGDTGGDLLPFFRDAWAPRTICVDVTFPDRLKELAIITGHLTPGLLHDQLAAGLAEGLTLPKVVAVHRGLGNEAELLRELAHVKAELGVQLVPGYQGMVL